MTHTQVLLLIVHLAGEPNNIPVFIDKFLFFLGNYGSAWPLEHFTVRKLNFLSV
uniref:Uncharacterized protein n=1 Tax=Arundo donax TaxID=35708 RepID=A0A0A8Y865_ARUDO